MQKLNLEFHLRNLTSDLCEPIVENYFNYFTEIQEHYLRRRGTHLPLSTLIGALIETWKSAGVPLEAVLREWITPSTNITSGPRSPKR